MFALRPLFSLILSLALVWGSAAQAVAHAQMRGTMDVTLCDAMGNMVTVSLDAAGRKVTRQSCLHCLAAQVQAVLPDPAPVAPQRLVVLAHATPAPAPPLPDQGWHFAALARAPPSAL